MRSNTLANALLFLKGELGYSLVSGVATAQDQELYTLIDVVQQWLASEYEWPFLKVRTDISVSAGTGDGTRYQTLPTTVDFEQDVKLSTLYINYWHTVRFGIGDNQYNVFSSGDGGVTAVQQDPIARWDWKSSDPTKFEVWPLPATDQTLRFEGSRPLSSLKTNGAYDSTKTLDLDDLLVVLFCAAQKLSRSDKGGANTKLALVKAEARLNKLRGAYPKQNRSFTLGGGQDMPRRRVIPIVTVA